MERADESLNDLVLEISLAASLPMGIRGTNFILAASAANALATQAAKLNAQNLQRLEHSIGPLLALLRNNPPTDPVAVKAAMGLKTLIDSRVNLLAFLEQEGMHTVLTVFQKTLMGTKVDLKTPSNQRNIVESCCIINREVGRFYPWKVVDAGMISHMVTILRIGDISLQSIVAATFSVISQDGEICKILFSNGCVKPILNVTDPRVTNDSCTIAGLGCIVQLSRIPEIGALTLQLGALPCLERALNAEGRFGATMSEKALFSLSWLSRIPAARPMIASSEILRGMKKELELGSLASRQTVVQMLLNLHKCYASEPEFLLDVRDIILNFLINGVWHVRNLAAKCLCVLYRDQASMMYFVDHGAFEAITEIITSKSMDLQEVPMVCLVSFLTHPDIPDTMWDRTPVLNAVISLLACIDDNIRNLAVIFFKALSIYDFPRVVNLIPQKRKYLFNFDDDTPELVGTEYGGMIQEYLQSMVENRRDADYLMVGITEGQLKSINLTRKSLQPYMDIFMELDSKCRGQLDIDGLKLILISIGEEVEEDILEEKFKIYDSDGSGMISFFEYLSMMQDYKSKGDTKVKQIYHKTFNKGRIGRARRQFNKWWNKDAIEKMQIQMVKDKREADKRERQELAAQHWEAEQLRLKREATKRTRMLLNAGKGGDSDDDDN